MKCFRCGNILDYYNKTTLVCPFCNSLYNVSESTAENQKRTQEKSVFYEKDRPNCNVVETQDNTKQIDEEAFNLEIQLPLNVEQETTVENKESSIKKEKTLKSKKNKKNIQEENNNLNGNNTALDGKKEKKDKASNEKTKNEKSFPPSIVFIFNLLMFLPIIFLPFIGVLKNNYSDGVKDISIYIFNKFNVSLFKELFSNYYILVYIGLILTIIIMTLLVLGIILYFCKKGLYVLYTLILILSLTNVILYFISIFTIPTGIQDPYTVNFISYIYFIPILSFINLIFINIQKYRNEILNKI